MTVAQRLRELASYRELVWNLTLRDLMLKYKGSSLGILWSLVNPLLMVVIYTTVFGSALGLGVGKPHYWAFVLSALLPWTFFSSAVTSAAVSFIRTSSLITKVYFPIEALPIGNVLAHFINGLIGIGLLIVVELVVGVPIGVSIVLLPGLLLLLLLFTLGVGLLLGCASVYFRDLEHVVGLAVTAGFFLTPVIYPAARAGNFARLLAFNPMTWYVNGFHAVLYEGTWPAPRDLALAVAAAIIAPVAGYLVFARLREQIPEEV